MTDYEKNLEIITKEGEKRKMQKQIQKLESELKIARVAKEQCFQEYSKALADFEEAREAIKEAFRSNSEDLPKLNDRYWRLEKEVEHTKKEFDDVQRSYAHVYNMFIQKCIILSELDNS